MTDLEQAQTPLVAWAEWPAGAPDVMLGGCLRLSARVAPVRGDASEADGTTFTMSAVAVTLAGEGGPHNSIAFIGVLTSSTFRERIRVDVLCPVAFRPESEPSRASMSSDDFLSTYGPWARHILYDFAANEARGLAGPSVIHHDLPQSTPRVLFSTDEGPDAYVETAST